MTLPLFFVVGPVEALPAFPPVNYEDLSTPGRDATDLDIAVADDGAAVAIWVETNFTTFQLWSAFYSTSAGWGTPAMLDNQSNTIGGARVAMDAAGNATVVWATYGSPTMIWFAQAAPGGPFGAPIWAHNVSVVLQWRPEVTVSAMGRAFFSWVEGSPESQFLAAVVEAGVASAAVFNLSAPGTSVISGALAADALGVGTAIWCLWNGSGVNLTFARYSVAGAWAAATVGVQDAGLSCGAMAAGSTPGGGVAAVWIGSRGAGNELLDVRFSPTAGWTAPSQVANLSAGGSPAGLSLSVAEDGAMAASWIQMSYLLPFFTYTAWVAAFDPAAGWQAATAVEGPSSSAAPVDVAASTGGFALAASGYSEGPSTGVQVRQHTRQAGCDEWSGPAFAEGIDTTTLAVAVGLNAGGRGIVLWSTSVGGHFEARAASVQVLHPPVAALVGPDDGTVVESSVVQVTGTAPPGSIARAGGATATADSTGNFSVLLAVSGGDNTVRVTVTLADEWSPCAVEFTRSVVFHDPVPELRAELANATANITVLEDVIVDLHNQVLDLEASGNASEGRVSALRGELTEVEAQLNLERARVASLSLELNVTTEADAATIASLQTQIDLLQQRLNTTANQTNANSADRAALDGARAGASFAMLLGAVGAILGAAGVALAITTRRGKPDHSKASNDTAGKVASKKAPDHAKDSDASAGKGAGEKD